MTIYVVSDRKHVRIAIYNLLGISPDPETGTRVIHKMTESDLSRATAEDTFAGNLPLEWLARIQERGAKTLVFEADGLDDASFDPTGPGRILDAVDKTGRLVAYDVTREPDAPAPLEVQVHVSEPDRRKAVFSYLTEKGIACQPGRWSPPGTMNRVVAASGKAVIGCGMLPRKACLYEDNAVSLYMLEVDFGEALVRYRVRRIAVEKEARGKRAFE
ncbi:hypothetical protein A3A38_01975 [Candidatus Kaiserbacteria bacterium RIFCSPLOWO2_01_FULL_53_17]|uniref:Uncharacterized protein n=1 Tax=Candidatus Kaiserbacteria bacterium RIFCSPLOWO2_01_FULL_53_17 TaxID=1798511 RepID=A0A1F6EFW4_9BACT|nr:MAG: hypothetical protein A3A38_01975 [Candidatus Kaiserbacteria bacterium RIFCSPLOWO2_01_FULL_53_17]